MIANSAFRYDINAYRAIAVVAVLLFHFFPTYLPLGYLGVDIFFVISGFLMYSIIEQSLDAQEFSVKDFIYRRVKRVYPALLFLIISVLLVFWIFYFPSQYLRLTEEVIFSIFGLSNYYYYAAADYFDTGSYAKPLLHTWSLSVELQFYVSLPILCFLIVQVFGRRLLLPCIFCFFVFSLSWHLWAGYNNSSFAFYDVVSRYWEFLVGSLSAALKVARMRYSWFVRNAALVALGIALLVNFSSSDVQRMIIVALTAVALFMKADTGFVLSNKIIQYLGNISYSLYLWHWPIACLIYSLTNPAPLVLIAGIVVSVAIAHFSYKFCEKNTFLIKAGSGVAVTFCLLFLTVDVFRSLLSNKSWEVEDKYISGYLAQKEVLKASFGECNFSDSEYVGFLSHSCFPTNGTDVFLWGDSQAASLSPGLLKLADNSNLQIAQATAGGCPPRVSKLLDRGARAEQCNELNLKARLALEESEPLVVVISQRFGLRKDQYVEVARFLEAHGHRGVFIGPYPEWSPSLPEVIARRHDMDAVFLSDHSLRSNLIDDASVLEDAFRDAKLESQFVNVAEKLCVSARGSSYSCRIREARGSGLFFFDYGHLTESGAMYVSKSIERAILGAPR
ncbi:MAG TPA: hypothetical protein DEX20_01310 [Halieaceae bacterium]|nr:hypothetical protein [Halieaceae bacterium]